MTVPALSLSPLPAAEADGDVLVLGVAKGKEGPELVPAGAVAGLDALLAAVGATGAADELTRLPGAGVAAGSIALIGLGSGDPDANALRRAAGAATRQLRGLATVVLGLPFDDDEQAAALLEGAAIGAYAFDAFRSKADETSAPASAVVLAGAAGISDTVVEAVLATASGVHLVRDLTNTPPNALTPETLAARAVELVEATAAAGAPISARVLGPDELRAEEYGGILGVGQGSVHPPRLVVVEYRPAGATAHLALVGKGITFDTGGLSLKPAASMVGMKYDMTGSATVLAAAVAAARLGIQTAVTAFMCIAENMAGSSAMRPNDVITIKGGTTVEVLNTDAEGRLVLGDGIAAASREHPDVIVDVATLTGAITVALGTRHAGVMGDDGAVADFLA
ncbi:MAG: leucyl aminopeptidase, partial [Microbacteriaceae bacterium]|nr:leucyl aminopeptidase [Microbacteriaceae bacterium]